jgi:CheY-like chemotaxis protein
MCLHFCDGILRRLETKWEAASRAPGQLGYIRMIIRDTRSCCPVGEPVSALPAVGLAAAPSCAARNGWLAGDWPEESPPVPSGEKANTECSGLLSTKTILLVEDDDQLRSALAHMLSKRSYVVLEAADGLTAVEIFRTRSHQIEVVLLDMTLPGISGLQVLQDVRRIRPDIRVILTSAYSREIAEPQVPRDLIYEFIGKPFRIADLLALLRK